MAAIEGDIPFKIIREDWNIYKLDNGSTLKIRTPLLALKRVQAGQTRFTFGNLTMTDPGPADTGKPSENQKIKTEDIGEESKFTILKEMVNIYETEDQTIVLVIPRIRSLRRTKKYDGAGVRIYQMDTQSSVSVLPFDSIRNPGSAT